MKLTYTVEFHSWLCSTISFSANIWSEHNLPFLNPAWFFLSIWSMAHEILFRTILHKILLVTDKSIIPLQFLQFVRSSFLGNLTMSPTLQSLGGVSDFHIFWRMVVSTRSSAFSSSRCIPSIPGALPFLIFLIASLNSCSEGGSSF